MLGKWRRSLRSLDVLRIKGNWAEKAYVWLPRTQRDIRLRHYSLSHTFIHTDALVLLREPSPFCLLLSPHILTSPSQHPPTSSHNIYHVGRGDLYKYVKLYKQNSQSKVDIAGWKVEKKEGWKTKETTKEES